MPQNLNATVDKHSIKYTWNELICGNRNGIIQHYAYTLQPGDFKDQTVDMEVTIDALDPCTEYTFSVVGVNGAGHGEQTSLTNTTHNAGMVAVQF